MYLINTYRLSLWLAGIVDKGICIYWFVRNYRKFKIRLEREYNVKMLTPFKILRWHQGAYYFKCKKDGRNIFLKTDYGFRLLKNEILAHERIKNCHELKVMSPIFFDHQAFNFVAYEFYQSKTLQQKVQETSKSKSKIVSVLPQLFEILDCLYLTSPHRVVHCQS